MRRNVKFRRKILPFGQKNSLFAKNLLPVRGGGMVEFASQSRRGKKLPKKLRHALEQEEQTTEATRWFCCVLVYLYIAAKI
jgi:hypothetical protein